jgi:PAS domain S-box-containing protein
MPASARPRPPDRTVRHHLAVLALALALPATLFVGVLLWRLADVERTRLEGQAFSVARAAALAVDRELAGLVSTVEVVSLLDSLRTGDLQAFDAQARAVRERTGINVVLRDLSGQQLVNTRLPWGEPLPKALLPSFDAEALRAGRPVVSDVVVGAVTRTPLFAVGRPVPRGGGDGEAAYLLNLSLPADRIRRALAEELASRAVPADWTVAVVDRAGLILARSRAHEEFVGKPATRDLQDATQEGQEGAWRGTTADGQAVFGAFARSRLSGWRVAVGVPEGALAVPLRQALLLLGALGAGMAALSAPLALLLGRRISRPIQALADRAAALGRGETVAPLLTPVREVNRVAGELEAASASLKEREAALRGSEARLRAILDTVPVGVVIAEAPSGRIVEGNKEAERLFGHPVLPSPDVESYREWVGRHPDGRRVEADEFPLARVVRGEAEHAELEVLYLRGDEREAWMRLLAAPIRDGTGWILGGVVACLDVDREKRAEAELRRLNEELENRVAERTAERDRVWRLSTDLMLVARLNGAIVAVNPAWTALLGWTEGELRGARFMEFVHPDDVEATLAEARKLSEGAKTLRFEIRYRHKDGSYRWLSWTAVPEAGFIHAVARDVTSEKAAQADLAQAQELLRQAQKMEAVGQLTGGVAHDFNNLLQVILGSLDMLRRRLPEAADERTRRSLQAAAEAAKRGAVLTARLLAFSRRQTLDPKPVDPNKLVAGMSDLLRRSLGEAVRIETVLAGGLWRTCADPNQLENAVLNLAVNARDAMPDEGGRLTIETANTHLDERYAREAEIAPGQYVTIAVSDTGSGMSPEVASRAFEPFFTTKDVGQGTGLGLSQVYGFVKQSGGHVRIYSEPGQGTTVKIYLPRLREGAAAPGAPDADAGAKGDRGLPLPAGKGETVLVVEDEESVRRSTADALRELGYRVLEADGAGAALGLLDAHGAGVDLLFTDVVMPGANGRRLADEARRRRPGLRVLFTTGYGRNAVIRDGGALDAGTQIIGKPFTVEELAGKLRAALGRREKEAAPGG